MDRRKTPIIQSFCIQLVVQSWIFDFFSVCNEKRKNCRDKKQLLNRSTLVVSHILWHSLRLCILREVADTGGHPSSGKSRWRKECMVLVEHSGVPADLSENDSGLTIHTSREPGIQSAQMHSGGGNRWEVSSEDTQAALIPQRPQAASLRQQLQGAGGVTAGKAWSHQVHSSDALCSIQVNLIGSALFCLLRDRVTFSFVLSILVKCLIHTY